MPAQGLVLSQDHERRPVARTVSQRDECLSHGRPQAPPRAEETRRSATLSPIEGSFCFNRIQQCIHTERVADDSVERSVVSFHSVRRRSAHQLPADASAAVVTHAYSLPQPAAPRTPESKGPCVVCGYSIPPRPRGPPDRGRG